MDGFGFVLGDAPPDVVHGPEIVLRRGVALLGGLGGTSARLRLRP